MYYRLPSSPLGIWPFGDDCLDFLESVEVADCIRGDDGCEMDEEDVAEESLLPLCPEAIETWGNILGYGDSCGTRESSLSDYCQNVFDAGENNERIATNAAGPDRWENSYCWLLSKDPKRWARVVDCATRRQIARQEGTQVTRPPPSGARTVSTEQEPTSRREYQSAEAGATGRPVLALVLLGTMIAGLGAIVWIGRERATR